MANLEDLVLSGQLFNGGSRSSSPQRSPSPDAPKWPNDAAYDSDEESRDAIRKSLRSQGDQTQRQSIGMGAGRTGVKGVLKDRDEVALNNEIKQARDIEEMNRRMEKASLGGKTFLEEERERIAEKMRLEGVLSGQDINFFKGSGHFRGRFGHLREVGLDGFLKAIEAEERGVWVVVHIFDGSLERCILLDESLSRLARQYPSVKFLRAKASALGFASTSQPSSLFSSSASRTTKSALMTGKYMDDDDETYADEKYDEEEDLDDSKVEVDTDMLPTILVYQSGDLVHNWVRIDLEAGDSGIDDFLAKHRVLPISSSHGNCGLPSDDEDDELTFSDDES